MCPKAGEFQCRVLPSARPVRQSAVALTETTVNRGPNPRTEREQHIFNRSFVFGQIFIRTPRGRRSFGKASSYHVAGPNNEHPRPDQRIKRGAEPPAAYLRTRRSHPGAVKHSARPRPTMFPDPTSDKNRGQKIPRQRTNRRADIPSSCPRVRRLYPGVAKDSARPRPTKCA